MPFYGNITDRKNQFTYDRIYGSYSELADNIPAEELVDLKALTAKDDGILVGRYILIDYEANANDSSEIVRRKNTDINNYGRSWDSTVWQKILANNKSQYILIADFNEENINEEVSLMIFGGKPVLNYDKGVATIEGQLYREKVSNNQYKFYIGTGMPFTDNDLPFYDTNNQSLINIATQKNISFDLNEIEYILKDCPKGDV